MVFRPFESYAFELNTLQVQRYMRALFEALAWLHSQKPPVIHRDIKPNNFLFSVDTGKCLLIDFGLAEFETDEATRWRTQKSEIAQTTTTDDSQSTAPAASSRRPTFPHRERSGTRGFRAPEILLRQSIQVS